MKKTALIVSILLYFTATGIYSIRYADHSKTRWVVNNFAMTGETFYPKGICYYKDKHLLYAEGITTKYGWHSTTNGMKQKAYIIINLENKKDDYTFENWNNGSVYYDTMPLCDNCSAGYISDRLLNSAIDRIDDCKNRDATFCMYPGNYLVLKQQEGREKIKHDHYTQQKISYRDKKGLFSAVFIYELTCAFFKDTVMKPVLFTVGWTWVGVISLLNKISFTL